MSIIQIVNYSNYKGLLFFQIMFYTGGRAKNFFSWRFLSTDEDMEVKIMAT